MSNMQGKIVPGVYQGGSAKQLTDDLDLNGDEILYIGDHIYGDIVRLKKDCNWRTALVVEELGEEIAAQKRTIPIEKEISATIDTKKQIEAEYIKLRTQSLDERSDAYNESIHSLQKDIAALDLQIAKLLEDQRSYFNLKWERVFRAGAEETFFAYQVEKFACIYMEKLTDFLSQSPLTYFRAHRRLLAHDIEG